MTLSGTSGFTGGVQVYAGTLHATAVGALGHGPATAYAGGLLRYGAVGAAPATSPVTADGDGQVDLAVVPTALDHSQVQALGAIQGSSAELAALTRGGNLALAADAIVAHESFGGSEPATLAGKVHFGATPRHVTVANGITSTTARDFAAQTTTLGPIDNVDPDGAGPLTPRLTGTFGRLTVDDSMVVFKYTYFGDVTYNGTVDAADYALIDNGFNFQATDPSLRNWANGDMNSDGAIDAADYALIDNAFNFQSGPLASAPGAVGVTASSVVGEVGALVGGSAGTGEAGSALTPVPEPGTMALLVPGGLALLRRRSTGVQYQARK